MAEVIMEADTSERNDEDKNQLKKYVHFAL